MSVYPGRYSAQIEGPFVVFLLGMRVNKFWAVPQMGAGVPFHESDASNPLYGSEHGIPWGPSRVHGQGTRSRAVLEIVRRSGCVRKGAESTKPPGVGEIQQGGRQVGGGRHLARGIRSTGRSLNASIRTCLELVLHKREST